MKKQRKILVVLLLMVNGYFIIQLIQTAHEAQENAWPLAQDVSWQWARIIIPALMLISSGIIVCMYYLALYLFAKIRKMLKQEGPL